MVAIYYLIDHSTAFLSSPPPRVVQNCPEKVMRYVGCGLKGVEKLQFWLRFEPTPLMKNQEWAKKIFWRVQNLTLVPLACKSNGLPLSYQLHSREEAFSTKTLLLDSLFNVSIEKIRSMGLKIKFLGFL